MSAQHTPGPERVVAARVSDELAWELTGLNPGQLSEQDAVVIRDRAQRRWDDLCECAAIAKATGSAS